MRKINRIFSVIMFILLVLTSLDLSALVVKAADDGYIEIRTVEDLYNIRNNLAGNYRLMNDIDLSEATGTGGLYNFQGNGWNPIGSNDAYDGSAFTGVFDGNGFSINGMNICIVKGVGSQDNHYYGLFAYNAGTIKNLKMDKICINGKYKANSYIGSITGFNEGDIINCDVSGSIEYEGGSFKSSYVSSKGQYSYLRRAYIGGIVGESKRNIEKCSFKGSINSDNTKNLVDFSNTYASTNYSYVGGIVGNSWNNGYVYDCCNSASIFVQVWEGSVGNCYVGGIVGKGSDVDIKRCFNNASITTQQMVCNSEVGGIIGIIRGSVSDCYNVGDMSGYYCGGISGGNINSYEPGSIYSSYNVGKLNGSIIYPISKDSVVNCFYLNTTTAAKQSGATALTSLQMKNKDSYAGFGSSVWIIDPDTEYAYPQLRDNRQDTEKCIDTLEWKIEPKKDYYIDDPIGSDFGVIRAYHINNTSEDIKVTADMITGCVTNSVGEKTVTVSYRGNTLDYKINVVERPTVESIILLSVPTKTEFVRGTAFDFSGCKVEVNYSDGTSEEIDVTPEMTTGGNISTAGKQTIVFTKDGKSVSFEITVVPVKAISFELTSLPTKLEYVAGDAFVATGMAGFTYYNNGDKVTMSSYDISGFESTVGTHTVTITVGDFFDSFEVTVIPKVVTNFEITTMPTKTSYIVGQTFDRTGLVARVTYNNGKTATVTNYTVDELPTTSGIKIIYAHYGDFNVPINVTMVVKQVNSIAVSKMPYKVTYIEGEKFDTTGLEITATYNDGALDIVDTYSLGAVDINSAGTKTINVSYAGKTVSFDITVIPKVLEKLEVVLPEKLNYLPGENFDDTGIEVYACYSNGNNVLLDSADYTISGYTGNIGTNIVRVVYDTLDYAFNVIVHNPDDEWTYFEITDCTAKQKRVKYCKDCYQVCVEEWVDLNGTHNLKTVPEKPATCTEEGYKSYEYCTECGTYTVEKVTMPAIGHKPKLVPGKIPTCFDSGISDGQICEVCGETIVEQSVVAPKGHTRGDWEVIRESTCSLPGLKVAKCVDCEDILLTQETAVKLHSVSKVAEVSPSCEKEGCIQHFKCDVCEKLFSDEAATEELFEEDMTIDKTGHINLMHVSSKAASIITDGNVEYWKCKDCSKCFFDEKCTLEASEEGLILPIIPIVVKQKVDISKLFDATKPIEKYVVSNKKVGKVSKDGIFKASKPGTVEITAYTNGISGLEEIGKITVTIQKPVFRKINLSVTDTTVNAYDYLSGFNGKVTKWESKKNSVVTVDEKTGVISVVGKGKTKIVAYIGEGQSTTKIEANVKVK